MTDNNGNMKIVITGNKMPLFIVVAGFAAVISAIIYSTVSLTKMQTDIAANSAQVEEHGKQLIQHAKIMTDHQINCGKFSYILDTIIKKVEKLEYDRNDNE